MKPYQLLLTLFSLVCLGQNVTAQSPTDSLWAVWSDTALADTTRIRAIHSLAEKFQRKNPDSVIALTKRQFALAQKNNYTKSMVSALLFQGRAYFRISAYDSALTTFKTAIALVEDAGIEGERYDLYLDAGTLYGVRAEYKEAEKMLLKALAIIKKEDRKHPEKHLMETSDMAQFYLTFGTCYYFQGDYTKCLDNYQKALSTSQAIKDSIFIGSCYINIGNIYRDIKKPEKAIENFSKGVDICEIIGEKRILGSGLENLGATYLHIQDTVKALAYFTRSLQLSEEMGNKSQMGVTSRSMGEIFYDQGNWEKALKYYTQSLTMAEEAGDKRNLAVTLSKMGYVFVQIGNYDQAISYGLRALPISQKAGIIGDQQLASKMLMEAYQAKGQYREAFDMFRLNVELRDSLAREENQRAEINFEYQQRALQDSLEFVQREAIKDLEIKNQRNFSIGVGISLLIVMILAIIIFNRLRITRRQKTEIETQRQRAERSEQYKQQFLANMSHEIRTPMNAINGMTDILLRRDPQDRQRSYLDAIKESSKSLLVILDDILDSAKIEAGKIALETVPFSLINVVENVRTTMNLKSEEKGLLLKTDLEGGIPPTVIGDPTRLRQILLNLTGNAIKFTEKGLVTIHLETQEIEEGKVMANFCISDTGIGIGEDRLEKIFESFEQAYSDTTRRFGGTGLGLSISKKLTEIQDGKIWVESEKGKGSKFYVSIPFAISTQEMEASVQAAIAESEHIASQLKGIKILLAEDNTFNAIVAQEELEDAIEDAEVVVAENGAIAVAHIAHGDFDIVLMDVQMPVMNGYEATAKIRALKDNKANIPIIAMTANVMEDEIERCFAAGMNEFIGKPFEVDELLKKIQSF